MPWMINWVSTINEAVPRKHNVQVLKNAPTLDGRLSDFQLYTSANDVIIPKSAC